MAEEVKLVTLFDKATSADSRGDDIALHLEITDRMNSRRRYCVEGIEYFKQLFKSTDLKVIEKTMNLLEACVKNCNIHFHRYVCSRNFLPVFTNVLKRKRKKLTVFEKMGGIYKSAGWRDIEKRVLMMFQLWADTFMMEEEKYPSYMTIYRQLRAEKIDFPARDPNSRFMIKYEGSASPAFELAEMEDNAEKFREENPPPPPPPPNQREQRQARLRQQQYEEGKELTEADIPSISYSDVDKLKTTIEQLEKITREATSLNSLLTEDSKECYRTARAVHKKIIILASVKAAEAMDENDTMDLLKIMDYLNTRIESFKKAINIYKHGGNQNNVHDMLFEATLASDEFNAPIPQSAAGNLIDLGDFLDLGEDNPLDALDRFVTGAMRAPAAATSADSNKPVPFTISNPPPMAPENPIAEEQKNVKKLTPPPGMNLLDFEGEDLFGQPQEATKQPPAQVDEFDFFAELASSHK